jgi:hypothetical protein
MKFAQFFHLSTGYVPGSIPPAFDAALKKPIPACGSDGILYLDGRWSLRKQVEKSREVCRQRGFLGFTLHAGESLLRERVTREYEPV